MIKMVNWKDEFFIVFQKVLGLKIPDGCPEISVPVYFINEISKIEYYIKSIYKQEHEEQNGKYDHLYIKTGND